MATEWQVTAQRQVDELTPQGTFEATMEVMFTTIPEGVTGTLKVPLRLYNADYVRAELDQYVSRIKGVQSL
jgi:hypothetical protein